MLEFPSLHYYICAVFFFFFSNQWIWMWPRRAMKLNVPAVQVRRTEKGRVLHSIAWLMFFFFFFQLLYVAAVSSNNNMCEPTRKLSLLHHLLRHITHNPSSHFSKQRVSLSVSLSLSLSLSPSLSYKNSCRDPNLHVRDADFSKLRPDGKVL